MTEAPDQAELVKQLRSREEELRRINGELDQFAYIASHDLRSPLRAIANLAEWIEEDCADLLPEKSREDLQLMRSRVERMEKLLESLLDYSRVGRKEDRLEMIDCSELARDLFALLQYPEEITLEIAPDLPILKAPRGALERIFGNLLSNAVKHHDRPDGRISISCRTTEDEYEFTVADDGPGIDAKHHQKVFGMFETLQRRDDVEGCGMGLALVKKTIEHNGGAIWLESALGAGCKFVFTWPRQHPSDTTNS